MWVSAQVDDRASAIGGVDGDPDAAVDLTKSPTPVSAPTPDVPAPAAAVTPDPGLEESGPHPEDTALPEGPAAEQVESAPQVAVQDIPPPSPVSQRADFGAHLEANYQRLVAQLFAITLDAGEAHDVVQDAYSRAWRRWSEVGSSADPTAWVRRVAVRSTQRSWRRLLGRLGLARPRPVGDGDPRTAALLAALARLPVAERRVVVLYHMVGMSHGEIASLEQTGVGTVRARLGRAHLVVSEGMAEQLPSVLGLSADPYDADPYDADPYGGDSYGGDSYDGDSYGGDPHDGDPYDDGSYGAEPYGTGSSEPAYDDRDIYDDRRYDVRYADDERLR